MGWHATAYAIDLGALRSVWGAGRIAPTENWHETLDDQQSLLLQDGAPQMHDLLSAIARGDEACVAADLERPTFAAHAMELWSSWLGRPTEFVGQQRWCVDPDPGTLEWLRARGVDLDLGSQRIPWPVGRSPTGIPRIITLERAELRTLHEAMRALAGQVPEPMRTEYAALSEIVGARAAAGLDLIEFVWG